MRIFQLIAILGTGVLGAPVAWAQEFTGIDIVILGEIHDNPAHHLRQARVIADIAPTAVAYEMLSKEQAAAVTPELIGDETALGDALNWEAAGWPDFSMYYPLFSAVPRARVVGAAVPRDLARKAMDVGIPELFIDPDNQFGLADPLPASQQSTREALQMAAHCDALPAEMLPGMVDIQRLRDATLARAALGVFEEIGGPVVVITGNGHARKDWGVPAILARAAPEVSVISLGQGETGQSPEGEFDQIQISEPVERPDPCLAFQ